MVIVCFCCLEVVLAEARRVLFFLSSIALVRRLFAFS